MEEHQMQKIYFFLKQFGWEYKALAAIDLIFWKLYAE